MTEEEKLDIRMWSVEKALLGFNYGHTTGAASKDDITEVLKVAESIYKYVVEGESNERR